VFVGDTLFVGDVGRPDLFPGMAEELAGKLYHSLHDKLLRLPMAVGSYSMKALGWVQLNIKSGSAGMNVIGGLIFGAGFALLGYCPGTIAGAVGNGYLDALVGGVAGILIGAGLFAALYPRLSQGILKRGDFGDLTLPRLFKVNDGVVVIPVALFIFILLYWLERAGL